MTIQVLSNQVINQIAAGEVVDRPASVVRELVDNSVDAGSSSIEIALEGGGCDSITVVDDGCGMEREDLLLSLERHATSKISELADLEAIGTRGFRGEALSAIASVSRLKLRSRTQGAESAEEVLSEGGVVTEVRKVSGSPGTAVTVGNLFFNTPARRKFLRQPRTEERRVRNWLAQYALACPSLRFTLRGDGKVLDVYAPAVDLEERAAQYFQSEQGRRFRREAGALAARGVLMHPDFAQKRGESLVLFVNGRLIADRLLVRAVRDGYAGTVKERAFPMGVLALEIPADRVDINVHPQKSEVRFREPQEIFGFVRSVVESVTAEFRAPVAVETSFSKEDTKARSYFASPKTEPEFNWVNSAEQARNSLGSAAAAPKEVESFEEPPFLYRDLRYVGQVLKCFLVCEAHERVYIIDMHAAHERIVFNRLRSAFKRSDVASQPLLLPQVVELGPEGLSALEGQLNSLRSYGFEIELFGGSSAIVRAVPTLLANGDIEGLLKTVVDIDWEDLGVGAVEGAFDAVLARLACHGSVRSGRVLEREEVTALLEQLDESEFAGACPHGRPVVLELSRTKLEELFGRIQ